MKEPITWSDFDKIDMRIGTILSAEPFPQARKPAYQLTIDLGPDIGIKKSSAQITHHYTPDTLVGKKIVAVVNFPPRQIGPMMSHCLVLGSYQPDGSVCLLSGGSQALNGSKVG